MIIILIAWGFIMVCLVIFIVIRNEWVYNQLSDLGDKIHDRVLFLINNDLDNFLKDFDMHELYIGIPEKYDKVFYRFWDWNKNNTIKNKVLYNKLFQIEV